MSIVVAFLEVFLWFALYPTIWWVVIKYLLDEYPVLNYLKLLSIPLTIALVIMGFMILRDSVQFAVVFLIEGPNESKWLGEQIPKIAQLSFWAWLLLPMNARFISLTDSRDYHVIKRRIKKLIKKIKGKSLHSSKGRTSRKRSKSKKRKS